MSDFDQAAIERACTRLVTAYARATDRGDGASGGALFTDDGELHMPGGRHYRGSEEIGRRIAEQPASQRSRHVLSDIQIDAHSPDRATGTMTLTIYRGEAPQGGGAAPLDGPYLVGEYDDEYRCTAQGWRIAQRRLTTLFRRVGA